MENVNAAGWIVGLAGLITAIVAAVIQNRKSKSEVAIEHKKLADTEAKEAYAEAKAALLLLVQSLQSRLETIDKEYRQDKSAYQKDVKEANDKHHKCEVDMAEVKADLRVMQVEMARLKDHDKRNTENKEQLERLVLAEAAAVVATTEKVVKNSVKIGENRAKIEKLEG